MIALSFRPQRAVAAARFRQRQGQASRDGEGREDEFVFQISKDEYLDLLF